MSNEKISIDEFIRENKSLLKYTAIEKELDIPKRTLQLVVGGRNVPKDYRKRLIDYFKNFGENLLEE
ncbi:MAG: hypothetical protein ABJF65_00095 [Reichenbachiella sp.]|uniref:hypothetical protein n=1 Tax=Reichenbachiella sp. TaxID=2184521 RepID=UPI00326341CB